MDIRSALRLVVSSGKVLFGERAAARAAVRGGAALIVAAANAPERARSEIEHNCLISGIPFYVVPFSSLELGAICGRPHFIAFLTIVDTGGVQISELLPKSEEEKIKREGKDVKRKGKDGGWED